jgi:hypothetical protein
VGTRGYSSLSFLFEAVATVAAYRKPASLDRFGDGDPSGMDSSRTVAHGIGVSAPHVHIAFVRPNSRLGLVHTDDGTHG